MTTAEALRRLRCALADLEVAHQHFAREPYTPPAYRHYRQLGKMVDQLRTTAEDVAELAQQEETPPTCPECNDGPCPKCGRFCG